MTTSRFIRELSEDERTALHQQYRQTKDAEVRTRCQMLLLSASGYSVSQIAALTFFTEETVLYWLERYEQEQLAGLLDHPRTGRPP